MTGKQLRKAFIADCERQGLALRKTPRGRVLDQNDQPSPVRLAWCDYVEVARRNGTISEAVALRAVL